MSTRVVVPLTALWVVLSVGVACQDSTAPSRTMSPELAKGGSRTTSGSETTTAETDSTATTSTVPTPLRFAPWAPPLQTYDTSFVAHQGWRSNHVIYAEDWTQFLIIEVPVDAQFVDAQGNPVPYGTPVPLTVTVDRDRIAVQFGPHGSQFTGRRAVKLWIYYRYADLAGTSPERLRIWYQAAAGDPWSEQPTTLKQAGGWLVSELTHFSNYAVAY